MKIGVVFPQTEIGSDPAGVRDYAQAAEDLGYSHLLAYDHVVGADPADRPPDFRAPYTHESLFHEPLVLYGYLAGLTSRIGLVTGIIILPQRQTVLVAKQAAEVDVLSGGRLRLGIANGWNPIEYESLNEDFHNRGSRMLEQMRVLRALWTQPVVDFTGKQHRIDRAGIKPLPVQQPIPLWMGGMSETVIKRAARHADGWFPTFRPGEDASKETIERLHGYLRAAGREPESFGIEGRVNMSSGTPDDWAQALADWQALGAEYVGVNTMGAGLASPQEHIDAIRRFKDAIPQSAGEFSLVG